MEIELTDPQRRALECLASGGWTSPGIIGNAMGPTKAVRRKAQAQGRRGATVANRLVKMGLVDRKWRGWGLVYQINFAGREALRADGG